MTYQTPTEVFQELFADLHLNHVLKDDKAISDAVPKRKPTDILADYRIRKGAIDFDIQEFFNENFEVTAAGNTNFEADTSRPVEEHIELLWDVLKRNADPIIEGNSRIPLRHPYIVPGGRFNEIYYWDSYFTMLGLQVSGRTEIIEGMMDNFAWMIDDIGHIPNGNRTYFLGRSQPPFFALMVRLLSKSQGSEVYKKYASQLFKEYDFWMKREGNECVSQHVVEIEKDHFLNRYFDEHNEPRAEMYATDVHDFEKTRRNEAEFYGDIRAACESGWDFSARWFETPEDYGSVRTSKILPVDLNCLLFFLEGTCQLAATAIGDKRLAEAFHFSSDKRRKLIQKYFWKEETGYFHDYDFGTKEKTNVPSLAGVFPLFFQICTTEQAIKCANFIEKNFLRPGGVVSTALHTGMQWDAPNGWAPLQWMTIQGLRNYGHHDLANEIKKRWVALNKKVYEATGKLMEKYNVEDLGLLSGGGEYENQDGFGWTNGVLLRLLNEKEYF